MATTIVVLTAIAILVFVTAVRRERRINAIRAQGWRAYDKSVRAPAMTPGSRFTPSRKFERDDAPYAVPIENGAAYSPILDTSPTLGHVDSGSVGGGCDSGGDSGGGDGGCD